MIQMPVLLNNVAPGAAGPVAGNIAQNPQPGNEAGALTAAPVDRAAMAGFADILGMVEQLVTANGRGQTAAPPAAGSPDAAAPAGMPAAQALLPADAAGGPALAADMQPAMQAAKPAGQKKTEEAASNDELPAMVLVQAMPAVMPMLTPFQAAVSERARGAAAEPADMAGQAPVAAASPAGQTPAALQMGRAALADRQSTQAVDATAVAGVAGQLAQGNGDAAPGAAPQLVQAVAAGSQPAADGGALRLPNGDPGQWQKTLGEALGERIVVQRERGAEQAVIRLDPPAMGQVEISIRHEAGALKVSISATHSEVLNQLRGVGEALRQDLEQKHMGEVSVQLSQSGNRLAGDDARGGGHGREQQRREPGRALAEGDGEATATFLLEEGEA